MRVKSCIIKKTKIKYKAYIIIKIHVRRAAAEDILKFTCICVCLCIYVFVCVTSPGHTNNDTDLKFGTHTPIDLI